MPERLAFNKRPRRCRYKAATGDSVVDSSPRRPLDLKMDAQERNHSIWLAALPTAVAYVSASRNWDLG